MKSLVTGGAGFIGSHIVDKLLEMGHEVIVIDNESAESNEEFYWNDKAQNYKYDVRDYENTRPLYEGVDYVFHTAAEARIQPAIQNPTLTTKTNVYGTCNVLQASRQNNVGRVMFSSTSASYGLKNKAPVREDMVPDCLNAYSITKVAGENLCKMFYDLHGLETVCFRYFNVYGERQPVKGQYAPVIGLFQRQHETGNPMTIVGDGKQRRDFTYVGDASNIMYLLLKKHRKLKSYDIFNICSNNPVKLDNIISFMKKNNIDPKIKKINLQKADILKTHGDNSKLLRYIKFKKFSDWKNCLKKTIAWYKIHMVKK